MNVVASTNETHASRTHASPTGEAGARKSDPLLQPLQIKRVVFRNRIMSTVASRRNAINATTRRRRRAASR